MSAANPVSAVNQHVVVSLPAIRVYHAIAAVAADLAKHGIGKDRTAPTVIGGFKFRGIDDVLNALTQPLIAHKIRILAKDIERSTELVTAPGKDGNPVYKGHIVSVKVVYEITSLEDGSSTTVVSWGDGFDVSDKATSKAISSAYKSMVFQTFVVPTEAAEDVEEPDRAPPEALREPAHVAPPRATEPAPDAPVERASKALVGMLRKAITDKGTDALPLVEAAKQRFGVEKAEELPKTAAAALLKDIQAL